MKKTDYKTASSEQLIQLCVEVLNKQEKAASDDNTRLYNKYFNIETAIVDELKSRPGDERRLLLPLLKHPGFAVRYAVAVAVLTIAPQEAVQTLDALAASLQYPYSRIAGSTLNSLKSGLFVPS